MAFGSPGGASPTIPRDDDGHRSRNARPRLAEVSHTTWIRQKVRDQDVVEADLPTEVTDHDLERAEDAVRELERLSLWPPRS